MKKLSELSKVLADDPWYASDSVVKCLLNSLPKPLSEVDYAPPEDAMALYTKVIRNWCADGSLDTYRHDEEKPTGLTREDYLKCPDDNLEIKMTDSGVFLRKLKLPLPAALFPDAPDNTIKKVEEETVLKSIFPISVFAAKETEEYESAFDGEVKLSDELEAAKLSDELKELEKNRDELDKTISQNVTEFEYKEKQLAEIEKSIQEIEGLIRRLGVPVESVDVPKPEKADDVESLRQEDEAIGLSKQATETEGLEVARPGIEEASRLKDYLADAVFYQDAG